NLAYQASLREETDGEAFSISGRRRDIQKSAPRDFRHDAFKASDKRNVMEVFEFDPEAPSFGAGGGRIESVRFLDNAGNELGVIEGGEDVTLEIICRVDRPIEGPIVGFYVRDRLGQDLFGDNTYL